ncbi:MAG TPA: IS110 family transposase [Pseudomonadales bacterium]|nr:IS110 family transposase [Pseudomonadales bacterium]
MSTFIGIDIGATAFEVVIRKNDKNGAVKSYQQTPKDHEKLAAQLLKLDPACVVMEATGIYYLNLAVVLFNSGLKVSVINPNSFNHFAKLTLTHSKTDGIDAALLAEYAQRMTPRLWTAPDPKLLSLRDIGRQINRLVGRRTEAKNNLHALKAKNTTYQPLIDDELEGIEYLEIRIERLRNMALEIITDDEALKQKLENLTAAIGIGINSAIMIICELELLPEHLKSSQVTRFAGLDVRLTQSGTSINKPGRLSKAGNAYLRTALFMPALSAVTHDPNARAFYQSLTQRGKKKKQALCAVMRKMLTGIWACLKLNIPFDSSKLFSEEHKKACA